MDGTSVGTTGFRGATWMELQTCLASYVRQELGVMAQVEQFSSFPHAASRALPLLLENIEMVALKEPTTVVSQVQRFPCGTG